MPTPTTQLPRALPEAITVATRVRAGDGAAADQAVADATQIAERAAARESEIRAHIEALRALARDQRDDFTAFDVLRRALIEAAGRAADADSLPHPAEPNALLADIYAS